MKSHMYQLVSAVLLMAVLASCSGGASEPTTTMPTTASAGAATTAATTTATVPASSTTAASTLGGIRYGDYLKQQEEAMASKKAEREKAALASASAAVASSTTTLATTMPSHEPIILSGTGDMVIEDVECKSLSRLTAFYAEKGNFVVWAYDANENKDLLINEIGIYGGTVYLGSEGVYTITVEADGPWAMQIENISMTSDTSFSGDGDFVSDIFETPGRSWTITHEGESNFIVKQYNQYGDADLLVNEIGDYSGTVYSEIKKDKQSFFSVEADGVWTISPQ